MTAGTISVLLVDDHAVVREGYRRAQRPEVPPGERHGPSRNGDYGQRHRIELDQRAKIREKIVALRPDWAARLGEDHLIDLAVLGQISATAMTRVSRLSPTSTAPSASAPPERPVPAPRGTNGALARASSRTTATTSSRVPGKTASPGCL